MTSILVIDDNPAIIKLMAKILKANDFEVSTASDGESGIKKLEKNDYDLVFTDLMMPDISGMEVLEHVISKSPKTMCIILTGHGTIKSAVDATSRKKISDLKRSCVENIIIPTWWGQARP